MLDFIALDKLLEFTVAEGWIIVTNKCVGDSKPLKSISSCVVTLCTQYSRDGDQEVLPLSDLATH